MSDFFAAAQFLEMSQDDKLSKPSFELYSAGYRLAGEDFDMGEIIPEPLGYEEADLGAVAPIPKRQRRKANDAYLEQTHGPTMSFGAAGRSPLRDRAMSQPAQPTALKVNPPSVVVADKTTLGVAGGAKTYTSVWRASQARQSVSNVDVASVHVVELNELVS
jgi:hypothetical protein